MGPVTPPANARPADGPCDRTTLLQQADRLGISLRTLERAKVELGIVSQQRREQGRIVWYWRSSCSN
jgi:hypothetical protein